MTSLFRPFAFVEMVSPYNKKIFFFQFNITRWLADMNFMFSWQEQYLTRLLHSLVRYCSCNSNIKLISSPHRVISSIYLTHKLAFFRETNKKAFSHPEEGRFVRQKCRCKLKLCHLFICGLYFIYVYIISIISDLNKEFPAI